MTSSLHFLLLLTIISFTVLTTSQTTIDREKQTLLKIKSEWGILLDSEFKARIADFGLARMLVRAGEPDSVSALAGSFGYMADGSSFGVVLLKLTTGREASGGGNHGSLAEWAWRHLQEGNKIADAVDKSICEPSHLSEVEAVFKLGIICTGTLPSARPMMKEVLQILLRFEQNQRGFQDHGE